MSFCFSFSTDSLTWPYFVITLSQIWGFQPLVEINIFISSLSLSKKRECIATGSFSMFLDEDEREYIEQQEQQKPKRKGKRDNKERKWIGKKTNKVTRKKNLLNAVGVELSIFNMVSERVQGFALLLQIFGVDSSVSFFCTLLRHSDSFSLSSSSSSPSSFCRNKRRRGRKEAKREIRERVLDISQIPLLPTHFWRITWRQNKRIGVVVNL